MKQSLKNWKGTAVVMGVDWGDSGKGRMIDDIGQNADVIVLFFSTPKYATKDPCGIKIAFWRSSSSSILKKSE